MTDPYRLDLVVLTPGEDDREALDALLDKRAESLGIRPPEFRILKHPRRDPGVFHEAEEVLRPFAASTRYALALFDHQGSGQEDRPADQVTSDLRDRLEENGWAERAEVILLQPELEQWVWADSPHVERVLGWSERKEQLRPWLERQNLWPSSRAKPERPRHSLDRALREVRVVRSSALYRKLAEKVSLARCEDPVFRRFVQILRRWFPQTG